MRSSLGAPHSTERCKITNFLQRVQIFFAFSINTFIIIVGLYFLTRCFVSESQKSSDNKEKECPYQ